MIKVLLSIFGRVVKAVKNTFGYGDTKSEQPLTRQKQARGVLPEYMSKVKSAPSLDNNLLGKTLFSSKASEVRSVTIRPTKDAEISKTPNMLEKDYVVKIQPHRFYVDGEGERFEKEVAAQKKHADSPDIVCSGIVTEENTNEYLLAGVNLFEDDNSHKKASSFVKIVDDCNNAEYSVMIMENKGNRLNQLLERKKTKTTNDLERSAQSTPVNKLKFETPNLSPSLVNSILLECLDIVASAHADNTAHLDLKLENIVIDASGQVSIIDFGNARQIDPNDESRQRNPLRQKATGTPGYIPPESTLHLTIGTKAFDIFALGIVFLELTTGKFQTIYTGSSDEDGVTENEYAKLLYKINNNTEIGGDVRSLILGMIAKDDKQRLTIEQVMDHPYIKSASQSGTYPILQSRHKRAYMKLAEHEKQIDILKSKHASISTEIEKLYTGFSDRFLDDAGGETYATEESKDPIKLEMSTFQQDLADVEEEMTSQQVSAISLQNEIKSLQDKMDYINSRGDDPENLDESADTRL